MVGSLKLINKYKEKVSHYFDENEQDDFRLEFDPNKHKVIDVKFNFIELPSTTNTPKAGNKKCS